MKKIHMEDIRLCNNAGMSFPVCAASEKLLDLDKTRWEVTHDIHKVTCKRCLRAYPRRYPWTTFAKNLQKEKKP